MAQHFEMRPERRGRHKPDLGANILHSSRTPLATDGSQIDRLDASEDQLCSALPGPTAERVQPGERLRR